MIGIGKKQTPRDVVDRFVDCHEKIRKFTNVALRLAASEGASNEEITEAAAGVRRYFVEALPRHTVDEDESVLWRLKGKDAAVDAALEQMATEHREHESTVNALVELCDRLAKDPSALDELRDEFDTTAKTLASQFEVHLEREETIIFPAMRRLLDADALAAIGEEMKARRAS